MFVSGTLSPLNIQIGRLDINMEQASLLRALILYRLVQDQAGRQAGKQARIMFSLFVPVRSVLTYVMYNVQVLLSVSVH